MAEPILLPPLGQTSDEMAIVVWYKKVGDPVAIAEPLLCVETDKAQVDVESAEEGVLLSINAEPGESLASGALLGYVGAPGEAVPGDAEAAAEPSAGVPGPEHAIEPAAEGGVAQTAGRVQVSPVVRKLAASLGIDLAAVTGTGPGGRIERVDLERLAVGAERVPDDPAPTAATASAATERQRVGAIRRTIARRLSRSALTPQFALQADFDARAAKAFLAESGIAHLTYTHLLLRALASTLREHPALGRVWDDDGPAYRVLPTPDIGLAVAGDDALFVITIPEPDRVPLADLAALVREAAQRGRTGSITPDDQRPAALSLSTLGMFGVDAFTAIVDPDQTAILAAGSVRDRVRAVDGEPLVVPELTVTLSVDHRAADGVQAARFLDGLRARFERSPGGDG